MSEFYEDFDVDVVGFDDLEFSKEFFDQPVTGVAYVAEEERAVNEHKEQEPEKQPEVDVVKAKEKIRSKMQLAPKPSLFSEGFDAPMAAGSLFDGTGGFGGGGGLFGKGFAIGAGFGAGGGGGSGFFNAGNAGGGFDGAFHPTATNGIDATQGFSPAAMLQRASKIEDQMRKRRAEEDTILKEVRRKEAVARYRKKRRAMKEAIKKNGGKKRTHYKARQALAKKRNRVGGRFKKEASPAWTGQGAESKKDDGAATAAAAAAATAAAAARATAVHASPCRAPAVGLARGSSGFALVA